MADSESGGAGTAWDQADDVQLSLSGPKNVSPPPFFFPPAAFRTRTMGSARIYNDFIFSCR